MTGAVAPGARGGRAASAARAPPRGGLAARATRTPTAASASSRAASNAQSTAYAVQGLLAVGAGGAHAGARARLPARPPAPRRQHRLLGDQHQTPVWVTAQALMAFERKPFPLAAVPREPQEARRPSRSRAVAPALSLAAEDEGRRPRGLPSRRLRRAGPRPGAKAPAAAGDAGLRIDRAATRTKGTTPPPPWAVVGGVVVVLGAVVFAFRRQLGPARVA